ncbi:MAG TPA: hypothetical protein VNO81_02965 [Candidatus Nitrosotenuis sp.]|nr:hypothetical protein [Candidatus Nitrosotenuis sp.]
MIPEILEALRQPRTARDLAGELGLPLGVVEDVLRLLAGRGYVRAAGIDCHACSVRALCQGSGEKVWCLAPGAWRTGSPAPGPGPAPPA